MKSSSIVYRRAEAHDAKALAALFSDEAMLHFNELPLHAGITYWEKYLNEYLDSAHLPLLALDADQIVGCAFLKGWPHHIRRKHQATLSLFAVKTTHRKQGIGRALVQACIDACDDWLNVRRIEVAFDESAALTAFYASFGFETERRSPCAKLRSGELVATCVMARINARIMSAPASPAMHIAKRRKSSPAKVKIRAASVEDAASIAAVFATRGAANGTLQHPYTATEIWHARLSAHTSTRDCIFVATINHRVVGNAGVHAQPYNPRTKHVCGLGLGVLDGYQGRGIGRALMHACLDFASQWANYSRIELTVHADNLPAIKLYQSLGFVIEGRMRDYSFREGGYVDALFMARLADSLGEIDTA